MQPENATPPNSGTDDNAGTAPASALRRPRYWLQLFAFWTLLPFVLVPLLDLTWGHPVKLPPLPIFLMLQWWAWVPLTPLIAALGRRFPLRQPRVPTEGGKWDIAKHALIHLLVSWLIAVTLNLGLAAMASLLPVEWSPALMLGQAFHVFEGFGALFQILYWSVLAANLFLDSIRATSRPTNPLTTAG